MNKRIITAILAVLISASTLCGCAEKENKPLMLDDVISVTSDDGQSEASTNPTSTSTTTTPTSTSTTTEPTSTSTTTTKPTSTSTTTTKPTSTSTTTEPTSTSTTTTKPTSTSTTTTKPTSTGTTTTKPSSSSTTTTKPTSTSTTTSTTQSEPKTTASGTSILNNYSKKWAYNHISYKQQQIYIRLFNAASSVSTDAVNIADLNATEDELYEAFWAFDYDNPQFLELGSGYSYSYSPQNGLMKTVKIAYERTSEEVSQGEFDRIAQSVLANAQTQASDYDKLKYVHDWIVNNTVYLNTGNDYDTEADGPLIYGNAICEGYSKAFMYFAQSMGFECVCAIGSAGGVNHMWNMVKLDGQWYHVDVTWDDPVRSDGKQVLRDDYFLKSDAEIKRDHVIDSPFTLPTAPNSYA